jgi:hypothetical protein
MLASLQDLDTTMTTLRSAAAEKLAACRAAWRDMTPRQRRRLTKAAIREFEKWLEEHPNRGRAKHS